MSPTSYRTALPRDIDLWDYYYSMVQHTCQALFSVEVWESVPERQRRGRERGGAAPAARKASVPPGGTEAGLCFEKWYVGRGLQISRASISSQLSRRTATRGPSCSSNMMGGRPTRL